MQRFFFFLCMFLEVLCHTSCKSEVKIESYLNEASPLVNEYEGMVIPYNIAPLNFYVSADDSEQGIVLTYGDLQVSAISEDGAIIPDLDEWKSLLDQAKGHELKLEHCIRTNEGWKAYDSFAIHVSAEGIDPYLPALDMLVSSDKIQTEMYAGVMQWDFTNGIWRILMSP